MTSARRLLPGSAPRLALLVAALAAAGCVRGTPRYHDADGLYWRGEARKLIELYGPAFEDTGPDALVGKMKVLSAHLLLREWEQAEDVALEVSTDVNVWEAGTEGERDALSALGREQDKPFHGEPHERVMADLYLGLLRYRRDDYEGALSCFRSALDHDRGVYLLPVQPQEAERGEDNVRQYLYEADWTLPELLAARCWSELGEEKESEAALERAIENRPGLESVLRRVLDPEHNILVVLRTGRAPRKVRTGLRGSVLDYAPAPPVRIESVELDGQPLAHGVTDDLYRQASTLGEREVDELNQEKARRQEALSAVGMGTALAGTVLAFSRNRTVRNIGLAGMLAGIATLIVSETAFAPGADLRSWTLLPGALAVAAGRAPPGPGHTLRVRVRDGLGSRTMEWEEVPVGERENVYLIRVLPRLTPPPPSALESPFYDRETWPREREPRVFW